MTPAEIQPLIKAWTRKEKRLQQRQAQMLCQLSNCILATGGAKKRYKVTDFMPRERPTEKALKKRMAAIFGGFSSGEDDTPKVREED